MEGVTKYVAGTSPNIFVTKCHDLQTGQMTAGLTANSEQM